MSTVAKSAEHAGPPHHAGEFILVRDLPSRVRALRVAGLEVPDENHEFFTGFNSQLQAELGAILPPGANLRVIDMRDLSEKVLAHARGIAGDRCYLVSSCVEISNPAHGMTLEVNRLYGVDGEFIGIGPRPGHPALDVQLSAIREAASGRPIVYVEDGTFTGATVREIIKGFARHKLQIESVILGFAFPESRALLEEIGSVETVYDLEQPVDWVPDHDFLPFLPNCGRVVGVQVNGVPHPLYDHQHAAFSLPYLLPFSPMAKWTGLTTASGLELSNLSLLCLRQTRELFGIIEEINGGKQLTFGDLQGTKPRCAYPLTVTNQPASISARLDTVITDYLADVMHEVC